MSRISKAWRDYRYLRNGYGDPMPFFRTLVWLWRYS